MKKNYLKTRVFFLCLVSLFLIGLTSELINSELSSKAEANDLSIILMIGDGMGYDHVKMARYVEVGMNQNLSMENLDLNITVMTHNVFNGITDSAAAATAMATGYKTHNGKIATGADGTILETVLEIAQKMNKSTGIVTTTSIQHATPASFMTHVTSRNNYDEITRQIVEDANVDLLLGGGKQYFTTQFLETMMLDNYLILENKSALSSITNGKLLGLFAESHMVYEQSRNLSLIPSLAEMTSKAIEVLQQNADGFFLMIEGGRIDHASHDNDQLDAILETIAFNLAVKEALNYVQTHSNSILIVTADHETGGLSYISDNLDSTLPSNIYTEEENRTIRKTRINQLEVGWSTGSHTKKHVPCYAYGSVFDNLKDISLIDNTDIFKIMNSYIHGEEISLFIREPISNISTRTIIIIVIFSHTTVLITVASIANKRKK
jgi:alkaline phosphatase